MKLLKLFDLKYINKTIQWRPDPKKRKLMYLTYSRE